MATFIHGIGASENIDSSGEVVSIAGLDISSLDKDGVFNYEHKSDLPAQVVGKVLKAKKIFSDADCEDDHQLYFWNKVKTPYLYVMGELFDDYSDSAREVAGKFRYDADHKNTNERNVMNFSVEGSKISKEGITVTRSIARKITITVLACNKMAVAEMVAVPAGNPKKAQVDELFKTETVEIETFTPAPNSKIWDLLKKEDPKKYADKLGIKPMAKDHQSGGGGSQALGSMQGGGSGPISAGGLMLSSEKDTKSMKKALPLAKDHQRGKQIGLTPSGQQTFSHGMVGDYHGATAEDHEAHAKNHSTYAGVISRTDSAAGTHHGQKASLHMQAAKSARAKMTTNSPKPGKAAASTTGPTASKPSSVPSSGGVGKYGVSSKDPKIKKNVAADQMNKALTAGSGIASPASLSQGEALAKETMEKALVHFKGVSGSPVNLKHGDRVKILGSKATHSYGGTNKVASGKVNHVFHGPFGNETHIPEEHVHSGTISHAGKSKCFNAPSWNIRLGLNVKNLKPL
jgi:hypothetical protein